MCHLPRAGPASALYVAVPVAYGLVVRREHTGPRRAFGLALALAAPVMLALQSGEGGDGDDDDAPSEPTVSAMRVMRKLN